MKLNRVAPFITCCILLMAISWCVLAYELIWGSDWKIAIVALIVNMSASEPVRRDRR